MKLGILVVSNNFSGAENVVKNLLSHIKYNLNTVLIVNNEIYTNFSNLGIKTYNLGNIFCKNFASRFFNIVQASKKLREIISKEDLNIINTHLEYSMFIADLLNKNVFIVMSLHGEETFNLGKTRKVFQNYIVKRGLRKANKIILVSELLMNNLSKKYKKKTVVIPNGVDSDVFKPLNGIKQKKNVILFAGRFIDIKGIQEIVNVAKKLPQYEFWFAGQGPLENLINLPNTKNLGFKTTEELVKLYNQATICIFPSYRESFGLVGLEAMACGRAVIVTPLGFSEYIENGKDGIIIPAKDEKTLKDAIVDLMTNEKKRKIIEKNARKKALQYSWDNVAKQYIDVLKEVIYE